MKCIGRCPLELADLVELRPAGRGSWKTVTVNGLAGEVCPMCGELVASRRSARRAIKKERHERRRSPSKVGLQRAGYDFDHELYFRE